MRTRQLDHSEEEENNNKKHLIWKLSYRIATPPRELENIEKKKKESPD